MKTLKQSTNASLKAELFSLNQLVKFATKGDGKGLIKEYIKTKNVTLNELTVSNLVSVMPENIKFKRAKNEQTGKFELTTEKRVKFSTWHILTLIDKLEQSK